MLRRRGSAPAGFLQQHHSELDSLDKPMAHPNRNAKNKREKRERSGSPPTMYFAERRVSEVQRAFEFEPTRTSKPQAAPGSNSVLKTPRHRFKRRDSEPMTLLNLAEHMNSLPRNNIHGVTTKKCLNSRDYHIVLLGQGGVGKSALLVRFTTGRFIHEYDPTLEMTYEMCADIDEEPATLHITDTANTHEPVYLNQNEGFIVAYSIDDARTFETAKQLIKLIRELKKQKGLQTSIVLVGNKVDLTHSRVVYRKEARRFAAEYECAFHETSAAMNVKVQTIFHDAVRQLRIMQFHKRANGPMHSIKNFFAKIKVDD